MIPYIDLKRVNAQHRAELLAAVERVIDSGWYITGQELAGFETAFADYCGVQHCSGVANGYDALRLILRAYIELGVIAPGDEVLVPANTYIASILAITENALTPVLVEPDENTFNINVHQLEPYITPRTKAVMVVHLYGRAVDMAPVRALAKKHGLKVIEDCA